MKYKKLAEILFWTWSICAFIVIVITVIAHFWHIENNEYIGYIKWPFLIHIVAMAWVPLKIFSEK